MSRFQADCSRCCGLCCIVPAQLKTQGFPVDKTAEHPCRHLSEQGRCTIHASRFEHGYGACAGFDCHGAGQWVTARCGNARWGRSVQDEQELAQAWNFWLPRFTTAAMLDAALALLPAEQRPILQQHIDALLAPADHRDTRSATAAQLHRDALALVRRLLARQ